MRVIVTLFVFGTFGKVSKALGKNKKNWKSDEELSPYTLHC